MYVKITLTLSFLTDIFNLYPSQDWCVFSIFRVHYWQPIYEEIHKDTWKTMFVQGKQKGCTLLSMNFFMLSLGSRLSKVHNGK